ASEATLDRLETSLRSTAADVAVVFTDRGAGADTIIGEIMSTRPVPILAGALEAIPWTGADADEASFHAAVARSARLVAGLALVKRRRVKTAEERPAR